MRFNLYIFVFVAVTLALMLPLGSSSLGTFKINDCINIRVLANCTSINLVEVNSNNQSYVINDAMTNLGGQTWNYNFCNTSNQGTYTYSWNNPCVDCSNGDCGNSFTITPTGQDLSSAKATTYIIIFIISLLIFAGLLTIGLSVDSSNNSDAVTGYILAVNNLKYLKYFCLALSYLVALFISFYSYQMCYAYLDMPFLTSIFYFIFIVLVILILPLLILFLYIFIANWIRDNEIQALLSRGLKTR